MRDFYLNRLVVNAIFIGVLFFMVILLFSEVQEASKLHYKVTENSSCPDGFYFNPPENACIDINECEIQNNKICPKKICQNLIGSYRCLQPSCPHSYHIHASHRSTHINKCVRKRCKGRNNECFKVPKYRTFKTIFISSLMKVDGRNGGLMLHEVFMRKFIDGVLVKIEVDECLAKDVFESTRQKNSIQIFFKNPMINLVDCFTSNSTTTIHLHIINKSRQNEHENVEIKLKKSKRKISKNKLIKPANNFNLIYLN